MLCRTFHRNLGERTLWQLHEQQSPHLMIPYQLLRGTTGRHPRFAQMHYFLQIRPHLQTKLEAWIDRDSYLRPRIDHRATHKQLGMDVDAHVAKLCAAQAEI